MAELSGKVKQFAAAVAAGTVGAGAEDQLVALKIGVAGAAAGGADVQAVSRDLYESAALYSLSQEDTDGFERHFALAKCAYSDSRGALKPSGQWGLIQGLYLMHLLVQNRLAEFHAELELLTSEQRAAPQIAFPITVEQYVAEGRYNKVLDTIRSLPDPKFSVFVGHLVDAVRGEIADCSAASYDVLPVAKAQRMMLFDTEAELLTYILEKQTAWTVDNGVISFHQAAPKKSQVPSEELIMNTCAYATELERIV